MRDENPTPFSLTPEALDGVLTQLDEDAAAWPGFDAHDDVTGYPASPEDEAADVWEEIIRPNDGYPHERVSKVFDEHLKIRPVMRALEKADLHLSLTEAQRRDIAGVLLAEGLLR